MRQDHSSVRVATQAILAGLVCGSLTAASWPLADDPGWPRWRGPYGNGAAVDPGYPLVADIRKARLVWQSQQEIPPPHDEGMEQVWTGGYASPIVAEGKVFLYYFLPHGRRTPRFNQADVHIFGPKAKSQHKIKKDHSWEAWHVDDIVQAFAPRDFAHVWSMPQGRKPAMGCTDAIWGDVFVQATDDRINTARLVDLHTGDRLAEIEAFRDLGYGPATCRGVLYGGMYDRTSFRLDPQSFEKFEEEDRSQWGNSTSPALAYGHLYHRTGHRLVCLDLRAR